LQGEPFSRVKERLAKKLALTEKEFDKFKFALVVLGRPTFINDEAEFTMSLNDLKSHPGQGRCLLALLRDLKQFLQFLLSVRHIHITFFHFYNFGN
jgi:hypothetical protein